MELPADWLRVLREEPTVSVPFAGACLGYKGKNAAYTAAQRGDIPTIDVGPKLKRVLSPWLRQKLGIE
jgi:hypothetical protein